MSCDTYMLLYILYNTLYISILAKHVLYYIQSFIILHSVYTIINSIRNLNLYKINIKSLVCECFLFYPFVYPLFSETLFGLEDTQKSQMHLLINVQTVIKNVLLFTYSEQPTFLKDTFFQVSMYYVSSALLAPLLDPFFHSQNCAFIMGLPIQALSIMILPYSAPIVSPSYFRRVRLCSGL